MALQPVSGTARYGFIPGSKQAGQAMGYGAGYQGIASLIETPEYNPATDMTNMYRSQLGFENQQKQWGRDDADWRRRGKLYDKLLEGIGNFSSNMYGRSYGGMIPSPDYASTAPIWNQQQINAQAGQQRAQMQAQAANQSRNYATSAAARGFSPMSPLTQFMQQLAGQRANIGAAQNETNLNWNAAEGNREAQQRGEGINAGLYGSYTSALARARDHELQAQALGQNQQMDQYRLLAGLLGRS